MYYIFLICFHSIIFKHLALISEQLAQIRFVKWHCSASQPIILLFEPHQTYRLPLNIKQFFVGTISHEIRCLRMNTFGSENRVNVTYILVNNKYGRVFINHLIVATDF